MKSRLWQLAGVGVMCVSVSVPTLAENQGQEQRLQQNGQDGNGGGQHPQGGKGHQDGNQPHPQNPQQQNQPRPPNNEVIRGDNSRQFEHNGQGHQGGQQRQEKPAWDPNARYNSLPIPQAPATDFPIQPRPDSVRQTQEPQRGYYQDIPRRYNDSPHWQSNTQGPRPAYDTHWLGRPDGHGNGWGPGPQYRPGYVIDRFPERNYRVPYRGDDYFYSGGYWYRPRGPHYVVVRPPYGIRVSYLPDYAREMWVGGSLFFLAAGAYYSYESTTRDYVVVPQPMGVSDQQPPPASSGYDVLAYPSNGQSQQQIDQDGYECYRWAVEQSGFDPRAMTYQPAPEVVQAYRQAQGNCLASRGYQVNY